MDSTLDERIDHALRGGIVSSREARDRVMAAVRASSPPRRGVGDGDEPTVNEVVLPTPRPLWRSPAGILLIAASIAGVIALVRAVGVVGPIADVPGQPVAQGRRTRNAGAPPVSAVTAGATTAPISDDRARVAKVQFVLVAPAARRVAVVGDFNDWDPAAAPLAGMRGVWSREVDVPYGRHDYAFVVDGDHWVRDPSAPQAPADEFGSGYSVIVVDDHLGAH